MVILNSGMSVQQNYSKCQKMGDRKREESNSLIDNKHNILQASHNCYPTLSASP